MKNCFVSSFIKGRLPQLTLLLLAALLFSSEIAWAGTGDKVTVSGGATTAIRANGDYYYAGTSNGRDYYDHATESDYRIEYRYNPGYGVTEWEVWESTARGGSGTVRFYNSSSSTTIPTGKWSRDVASGDPFITFTAAPAAPGTQATAVVFPNTTASSTTVAWTIGNGAKRAVFMKAASSGTAIPDGTYTANTVFGSGTQIGASGWFCVYNGSGASVSVTGLSAGATYRVQVFEYNGNPGSELYLMDTAAGNPNNVTTLKNNQTISSFLPAAGSSFYTVDQVDLSATASSGLTVTFSDVGGGVIWEDSDTISFQSPGTVRLVASQAGDASYNAAPSVTNVYTIATFSINMISVDQNGNDMICQLSSISNHTLDVEATSSLTDDPIAWTNLGPVTFDAVGYGAFTETNAPAVRFYRLKKSSE